MVRLTERDDLRDRRATLEGEAAEVERRIARLITAIETGVDTASVLDKLRELEARKVAIADDIAALQPVPRLPAAVVEGRLAEWRRPLRQSPAQGRALLQRILDGRLTLTPIPATAMNATRATGSARRRASTSCSLASSAVCLAQLTYMQHVVQTAITRICRSRNTFEVEQTPIAMVSRAPRSAARGRIRA